MPLNTFTEQINGLSVDRSVTAQVITMEDGLSHPYFSSVDISSDNSYPIGIAKFHMIYDEQILNYWTNYNGVVVVSFNISDIDRENTNSLNFSESHNLNGRLQNEEYNYSFICKVSRIKQKGKEIIILLEDLGWKFLQKIPDEFRKTYIANQYCDDAFQAICEFIGVQFAYSIEDLHEFQFGADGYSITKDGETIESVQNIFDVLTVETEDTDPLDDPMFESEGLLDLLNGNTSSRNTDTSLYNENVSSEEDTSLDEKVQELQEEFEQKIIDLFIGNTYYESDLTSPVMDYGRITVTPTSNTNSSIDNTESSTPEETEEQSTVNQQMHDSSQKTVKTLTKLTKAILTNPKATKALAENLLPKNAPKGSLSNYLQEASTDKEKQKALAKALKSYVRNPT